MKIKKALFIIMMFLGLILSFGFAGNISYENVSSQSSLICDKTVKDVNLYIPGTSVIRYPFETLANVSDSVIIKGDSLVKLWRNGNIDSCDNRSRVSNIVPGTEKVNINGQMIYPASAYKVVIKEGDGCSFLIPSETKESDPYRIDSVIYYDVAYGVVWENYPNFYSTYWYSRVHNQTDWDCYPDGNNVSTANLSSCPTIGLNYSDTRHYVGDCLVYRHFWCGDGLVDSADGSSIYSNGTYVEVCDDGDDNGNIPGGCNANCDGYVPGDSDPVCDSITPPTNPLVFEPGEALTFWCNGNTDTAQFRLEIYHNGTIVNSLTETKNTNVNGDVSFTKILSSPSDNLWDINCIPIASDGTEGTNGDICERDVTLNGYYEGCGDGILQVGEECEFYDGTPENPVTPDPVSGCDSDCQLRDVDCRLYIYDSTGSPTHTGIAPFTEGFGARSLLWAEFINLNFDDGSSVVPTAGGGNPPWLFMNYVYHTYEIVGHYDPILYVRNRFDEIIAPGVSLPEAECSTYVDVTGESDIRIEKINLNSNFVYPAGGEITFRIDFGNDGNLATTVNVSDVLPNNLFYLTSSIFEWGTVNPWKKIDVTDIKKENLISLFFPSVYAQTNFGNYSLITGDHYFEYSNIILEPGMSGYILITATISDICNGVFQNTGFIENGIQSEYAEANFECDDDIWIEKRQSVNGGPLTTGTIYVEPYDFVEYTIYFSANQNVSNAYIYDLIPAGMKFISGDMLPLTGNPLYSGWVINNIQEYVQSQTFNMNGNVSYYANITVQVISGFDVIGNVYENIATLEGTSSSVIAILTGNLPGLSIEKKLTNTGFYLGEDVGFMISFANTGYSPATGLVITDIMPSSLAYNGNYSIVGASYYEGPTITDLADGSHEIIFDNITIEPFTTGYILLTGVVQNYDGQTYLCDNAINRVFMSGSVLSGVLYDDEPFDCTPLAIEKFVIDEDGNNLNIGGAIPSYISGNIVLFEIVVEGLSDDVTSVTLEDVWADEDENCVEFVGRTGTDWEQEVGGNGLNWNYLGNDSEAHLFLSGLIVSDEDNCVGIYTNTGIVTYVLGDTYVGSDDAEFAISSYNMVIQKTSDIVGDVQQGDLVTFTLAIENRGSEAITNVVISDIWPGTLDIVPGPDTTSNWFDYNGVGSITSTNITSITGGLLLQWFFDSSFAFQPGETGEIIVVGRLVR